MKRSTIAKDFEAKQANPGGVLDRTVGSEAPLAATVVGTTGGAGADWAGNGIATDQFASKDELGELRQAMAMKVSETSVVVGLTLFCYFAPSTCRTGRFLRDSSSAARARSQ